MVAAVLEGCRWSPFVLKSVLVPFPLDAGDMGLQHDIQGWSLLKFCGVSAVMFSSHNASFVLVSAVFIRPLKRKANHSEFARTRQPARLKDPLLG